MKACKNSSFSLSQPVLSANPTASRHTLQNWKPPLKILHYDHDTEDATENSNQQDITPFTDKMCSEESNGDRKTAMDNTGEVAEEAQVERKTISFNRNNQKDTLLGQQSIQEYVPTKNEESETEVEKSKCKETKKDEAEKREMSSASQEPGKKEPESYFHHSSDITSNKDNDPLNMGIKFNGNDCNMTFTDHTEKEMDQCLVPMKHTQNNSHRVLTKEETAREQVIKASAVDGPKKNILNKSDISFLTQIQVSSDWELESEMKPSNDSVTCQIQSLIVKSPVVAAAAQYMHSIRTLIGSEEESPLPLDLVLEDTWNQSHLPWGTARETEQPTNIQIMPQATTLKISEKNSRASKCERKGDTSGHSLTAHTDTNKNKLPPLEAMQVQTVCNSGNDEAAECKEYTHISDPSTDLPINKLEVHLDQMIKNTSPSVAAIAPQICTVQSVMLQSQTKQADTKNMSQYLDRAGVKTPPNANLDLNNQSESPKITLNICDEKSTMVKRQNEVRNIKTASQPLVVLTHDYSDKIKSASQSPTMIANKCNVEQTFIHSHAKGSNTASSSTVSTTNETDQPEADLNGINENGNCSKHPMKDTREGKDNIKAENTELPNVVHPSTSMRKEFLPKQNERNQSKVDFDKFTDTFCKSPPMATEAPNICNIKKGSEDPLTNENMSNTHSHCYLLDDDIGLTGSQLLRIEDACQFNIQSCDETRVPNITVPANWAQNMQEKRQKLRSIIQDISRLK